MFHRVLAVAAMLPGLWACGPGTPPERHPTTAPATQAPPPSRPLEILIDWQAEPTYLGIYYAKTLGAYRKLGYDVTVVQSWGANEATMAIAGGRYRIGTASGGATVIAGSNGADVLSLAVLYHRLPTAVFGLASSGIKKPRDLEGKTVGIYTKSITRNEFDVFVELNAVDKSKINVVGISGPDLPLLLTGKADALLNYFELSPTQLAMQQETFRMMLDDHGVKAYGLNIVAQRASYQKDPEGMRALANAMLEGYRRGCANPKAAISAFLKEFPEKDAQYVEKSWDEVCGFIAGDFGSQTTAGWQTTIDLYSRAGLLGPKTLKPEDVFVSE